MRKIGAVLIVLAMTISVLSNYLPKEFPAQPIVLLAFGYYLLGIYVLIKSK